MSAQYRYPCVAVCKRVQISSMCDEVTPSSAASPFRQTTHCSTHSMHHHFFLLFLLLTTFLLLPSSFVSGFSSAPASPGIPPDITRVLRLGIVVPFTDGLGLVRAAAPLLAAQHINTMNESILPLRSMLHPALRIETLLGDTSGGSNAALLAALNLLNSNAAGLVGDSSSSRCIPEGFVLGQFNVPQVSHSCTNARLSDKDTYPTFFRLVPPDDRQGVLLARFVMTMKWRRVAILMQDDLYATGIVSSFSDAFLAEASNSITSKFTIPTNPTTDADLDAVLRQIQDTGARIVLIIVFLSRATGIFTRITALGMATDEYVYIGAEGTMGVRNAPPGLVGSVPYNGYDTQGYANLKNMWTSLNMTDFPQLPPGLPDLFQVWPDSFVPTAYDSLIAFALAASQLLWSGQNITANGLIQQFKNSTFTFPGVSGNVHWDAKGDSTGKYCIANWQLPNDAPAGSSPQQDILALVNPSEPNFPIPSSIFTDIRFHDGTNKIPPEVVSNFQLNLIVSGRQLGHATPVDHALIDCVRNKTTGIFQQVSGSGSVVPGCLGGFGRRAAYVKQKRAVSNSTVVVDISDSFFGTPYQDIDQGVTMAQLFDATGYDFYGVGISDLFLGPPALGSFIAALPRPCTPNSKPNSGMCVVASNLDTHNEPALQTSTNGVISPRLSRYVVKNVQGRDVAFLALIAADFATYTKMGSTKVGVSTNTSSTTTPAQLQVMDLQDCISQVLQSNPHCNIFVLLGDSSGDWMNLLPQVPQIDAVLTNYPTIPSRYTAWDSSGVVYTVDSAPNIPVINVNQQWRFVDVNLNFDIRGEPIANFFGNFTDLSDNMEDALVSSMVSNATDKVDRLFSTVIARIPATVDGSRGKASIINGSVVVEQDGCRVGECPAGMLVADAIRTDCDGCWFSHLNTGSIRTSLFYKDNGGITRSDIFTVLPFGNIVNYYTMRGSDVLLQLNAFVKEWNSGSWPVFSGLRFAYSAVGATQASELKVVYCEVLNPTTKSWDLINPDSYYKIATNDFVPTQESIIQTRSLNFIKFGRVVADVVIDAIKGGTVPYIPHNETASCAFQILTLPFDTSSTINGKLLWPVDHQACRIIQANQAAFVPCGLNEVRPPGLDIRGNILDCECKDGYIRDKVTSSCVLAPCGANEARVVVDVTRPDKSQCQCIPGFTRNAASGNCQTCPKNMVKKHIGEHPCVCDSGYYNISSLSFTVVPKVLDPIVSLSAITGSNSSRVLPTAVSTAPYFLPGSYDLQLLNCRDLSGSTSFAHAITFPVVFTHNVTQLWQFIAEDLTCQPCPECMTCYGDREQVVNGTASATTSTNTSTSVTQFMSYLPNRGYWWSGSSPQVYYCPFQSGANCPGYGLNTCTDSTTGPLCSVCADGYGSFNGKECKECPNSIVSRLMMALVVIAILVFIGITIRNAFNTRSVVGVTTKIFTNFLHVNMFIFRFRLSDSSILNTMAGLLGFSSIGGAQTISYNCAVNFNSLDQSTILSFFCFTLIFLSLSNIIWSRTCKSMCKKQKVRSELVAQAAAASAARAGYNVSKEQQSVQMKQSKRLSYVAPTAESKAARSNIRLFPVCIILLFMVYPGVVQQCLSLIRDCWIINDQQFMVDDLRIDCKSSRYFFWLQFAYIKFALIGVAFPLAILGVLYRREKIEMLYEPYFFDRYRFLFEGYRRNWGWWEGLILFRQFFIAIVSVMLSEQPNMQAFLTGFILLLACAAHTFAMPFDSTFTNRLESWSLFVSMMTLCLLGMAGTAQNQQDTEAQATSTADQFTGLSLGTDLGASATQSARTYNWGQPVIWLAILAVLLNVLFAVAVARVVFPSWFKRILKLAHLDEQKQQHQQPTAHHADQDQHDEENHLGSSPTANGADYVSEIPGLHKGTKDSAIVDHQEIELFSPSLKSPTSQQRHHPHMHRSISPASHSAADDHDAGGVAIHLSPRGGRSFQVVFTPEANGRRTPKINSAHATYASGTQLHSTTTARTIAAVPTNSSASNSSSRESTANNHSSSDTATL